MDVKTGDNETSAKECKDNDGVGNKVNSGNKEGMIKMICMVTVDC
jgi:hypothetical protein